jgi:hypothetical protein
MHINVNVPEDTYTRGSVPAHLKSPLFLYSMVILFLEAEDKRGGHFFKFNLTTPFSYTALMSSFTISWCSKDIRIQNKYICTIIIMEYV